MSALHAWSAPAADVPPGTSAKFPLSWRGAKVEGFVVNFEGRYHAYVNRCAHAGTPLDWWPNEFFTDDGRLLVCATPRRPSSRTAALRGAGRGGSALALWWSARGRPGDRERGPEDGTTPAGS
jgi:nitrite reductase/ring-hydroxylating ferredoxin subunit